MPRHLSRQFLVYLAVGVLCAIVDIGLMQILIGLKVSALISASCGFAAGLMLNFALHSRVTFGVSYAHGQVVRYLMLVLVNYLMTILLVSLTDLWWGHALAGKIISLPLVALNGFVLGRFWIFNDKRRLDSHD